MPHKDKAAAAEDGLTIATITSVTEVRWPDQDTLLGRLAVGTDRDRPNLKFAWFVEEYSPGHFQAAPLPECLANDPERLQRFQDELFYGAGLHFWLPTLQSTAPP